MSAVPVEELRWTRVCAADRIAPERGVAALIFGVQVAVFRTFDDEYYAVDNHDPFSGSYVISRGIVGSRGATPTVASPMFKNVFDLRTGRCLDDESVSLASYATRLIDGQIEVQL